MSKEGEKPGTLGGLAKTFLRVPYSPVLTRGEQSLRELVQIGAQSGEQTATLARIESLQRHGNQIQALAQQRDEDRTIAYRTQELLGDIAWENARAGEETAKRISDLGDSFEFQSQATRGTPRDLPDFVTFTKSGIIDINTLAVLSKHGLLIDKLDGFCFKDMDITNAHKMALCRYLGDREGFRHLLGITNFSSGEDYAAIDKYYTHYLENCSSEEKEILIELCRIENMAPHAFEKYMLILARYGMLNRTIHYQRAATRGGAMYRAGTEGTNLGIRELNEQMDDQLQLSGIVVRLQQVALQRDDEKIALHRRTNRELAGIRSNTEEIADNTTDLVSQGVDQLEIQERVEEKLGALLETAEITTFHTRRIATGVKDMVQHTLVGNRQREVVIRQGEIGIEQREVQIGHLADINANTGEIAQNTSRIAEYTRDFREGVNSLVRVGENIEENTAVTAQNTGVLIGVVNDVNSTIQHYGEEHGALLREQIELSQELLEVAERGLFTIEEIRDFIFRFLPKGLKTVSELLERIDVTIEQSMAKQSQAIVDAINSVKSSVEGSHAELMHRLDAQEHRETNKDKINAEESYRKGKAMLRIGDIDEAIKYFDEAQDRWPADYRVYFQRGLCYIAKDDEKAAEQDLIRALKLLPRTENKKRAIVLHNLGRLYYSASRIYLAQGENETATNRLGKSLDAARLAIEEYPNYPDARFAQANYFAASGAFNEAFEILIKIIPEDPKYIMKIKKSDVFEPLRKLLETTLNTPFDDTEIEYEDMVRLTIMVDAIKTGNQNLVLETLSDLIKGHASFLNYLKFWRTEELKSFSEQIKQMILSEIEEDKDAHNSEDWYALASIAMNIAGISIFKAYDIFFKGTKSDPDFASQDVKAIRDKIVGIFGNKSEEIIDIIKTIEPIDFPWLISKL